MRASRHPWTAMQAGAPAGCPLHAVPVFVSGRIHERSAMCSAFPVGVVAPHCAVSLHPPPSLPADLSTKSSSTMPRVTPREATGLHGRQSPRARYTSRGSAHSLHARLRVVSRTSHSLPALPRRLASNIVSDPSSVGARAITQRKSGCFSFRPFQPPSFNGSIRWRSSYFLSLCLSGTASLDGLTA